jgi:hypothetical protein
VRVTAKPDKYDDGKLTDLALKVHWVGGADPGQNISDVPLVIYHGE